MYFDKKIVFLGIVVILILIGIMTNLIKTPKKNTQEGFITGSLPLISTNGYSQITVQDDGRFPRQPGVRVVITGPGLAGYYTYTDNYSFGSGTIIINLSNELKSPRNGNDSSRDGHACFLNNSCSGFVYNYDTLGYSPPPPPPPPPPAAINCQVQPWTSWSDCTGPCGKGNGTQTRTRSVTDGNSYGRKCSAEELKTTDTRQCDMPDCPVDCQASPWSSWSACKGTCGKNGGKQTRTRTIVNPNSTGRKCSLDETRTEETQSCDMPECPIDCKVGPWSEWSPAGQQGGLYMRKRSRNVRPNNSTGKPCSKLQERTDEIIPKCGVSVEDD